MPTFQQGRMLDEILSSRGVSDAPSVRVYGLSMDSRLVVEGDLYLALPGQHAHGLQFAYEAVEAGAVAVLCSLEASRQYAECWQSLHELSVPVCCVDGFDQQVAAFAGDFYGHPDRNMQLIAVTGTDGKTSVCQFVAEALQYVGVRCGYIGTLGWGLPKCSDDNAHVWNATALTTPDVITVRRVLARLYDQGATVVALEASSHGLSEGRLDALQIDIAVLTNLGRDHLDYHGSEAAYRAAKERLFRWPDLRSVVLNASDAMGRDLLMQLQQVNRFAYSSQIDSFRMTSEADMNTVFADNIAMSDSGLQFDLHHGSDVRHVGTGLLGHFNVDNLLACYGVLLACGIASNDAVHAIAQVTPVAGRMERLGGYGQPTVVVDYSHTPQALRVAISAVRVHCVGELWVVFGCGGDRDSGKRPLMAQAAESADHIVVTDDNPRTESSQAIIADIVQGFSDTSRVMTIADRAQAIDYAIRAAQSDDWVLLAGKGHENYQVIGSQHYSFSDRDQALACLAEAS